MIVKKYFNVKSQVRKFVELIDYRKSNCTDICAIIDVKAHTDDAAKELAQEILDKFIYSVKLFNYNSFISNRKNSYYTINESIVTYNKSSKSSSLKILTHYHLVRPPNGKFNNELQIIWEKLCKFLYAEHLTSFHKSILNSMYWYGTVDHLRDSNVKKFLYYLIGLEKILICKHEQSKAKKFGLHCSIIFSGNEKYQDLYEQYYKKRNDIIHDENVRIYDEQVDRLKQNLQYLLLNMIKNSDKYVDIKSYYNNEYNINL